MCSGSWYVYVCWRSEFYNVCAASAAKKSIKNEQRRIFRSFGLFVSLFHFTIHFFLLLLRLYWLSFFIQYSSLRFSLVVLAFSSSFFFLNSDSMYVAVAFFLVFSFFSHPSRAYKNLFCSRRHSLLRSIFKKIHV